MRMVVVGGVRYREDQAPKQVDDQTKPAEATPPPKGKASTAAATPNKATPAPESPESGDGGPA